jgi:hypothetical protein
MSAAKAALPRGRAYAQPLARGRAYAQPLPRGRAYAQPLPRGRAPLTRGWATLGVVANMRSTRDDARRVLRCRSSAEPARRGGLWVQVDHVRWSQMRPRRRKGEVDCAPWFEAGAELLRLCAILRSRPEPPPRRSATLPPRRPAAAPPLAAYRTRPAKRWRRVPAPRFRSQPASSLEHVVKPPAPKQTAATRNSGNQFLAVLLPVWAQVCG